MSIKLEQNTDKKEKLLPRYRVLLHNDDHNVMEYVAYCLIKIMLITKEEAIERMLEAHKTGVSLLKIEPFEPAEFHRDQLRSCGLVASIEPEK